MRAERFSMLLLLAAALLADTITPTCAEVRSGADLTKSSTNAAQTDVVEALREAVQTRLSAVKLIPSDDTTAAEIRGRLAQFFNFPNFMNAYCFRGYWRNC